MTDPYDESRPHDPVVDDAVAVAVAATEPPRRHPLVTKAAWTLVAVVSVLAVVGAVLGAVNSAQLRKQSAQLKVQQTCLLNLVVSFESEQIARDEIASEDRTAVDDLVSSIVHAKSKADLNRAFANYETERAANNKKREALALPNTVQCGLPALHAEAEPSLPTTPSASHSVKPTATKHAVTSPERQPEPSSVPRPATTKAHTVTVTKTVSAPQKRATHKTTKPAPSTKPVVPVPSLVCKVSGLLCNA